CPGHLHRAVLGLGGPGGFPSLDGAGGGIGINWVALAAPAAGCPVGPVDLQDPLAVGSQEADQAGAVAAGAFHPPHIDLAEPARPAQQLAVASPAGWGDGHATAAAELVP